MGYPGYGGGLEKPGSTLSNPLDDTYMQCGLSDRTPLVVYSQHIQGVSWSR